MNGRAFAKASAEISEKSSGNQKSEQDFEISYAKTARVGPLGFTLPAPRSCAVCDAILAARANTSELQLTCTWVHA